MSQEFRLKKIKEIINYFIKEIDQNELLSNKKNQYKSIIKKKKKKHDEIPLFFNQLIY